MRIGTLFTPIPAGYYRAIYPLRSMKQRGHEVVWPSGDGMTELTRLISCDVVHIYRRSDDVTRKMAVELGRRGVAIVYDNDDDLAANPRASTTYEQFGGLRAERAFVDSLKVARAAHIMTTTSEPLAAIYREKGVADVRVIPNMLGLMPPPSPEPHDGVVIGWIAGAEHAADLDVIPLRESLNAILERHEAVRVECIGLDLRLASRYRHDDLVDFTELPARMARWDIAIAPLADIPFNRSRSDIKLKEYAAAGVPWLASPVGPYASLGEREGGRLVDDDGWVDALDELVRSPRLRRRLARRGRRWSKRRTADAVAAVWDAAFQCAAARASSEADLRPARSQARTRR